MSPLEDSFPNTRFSYNAIRNCIHYVEKNRMLRNLLDMWKRKKGLEILSTCRMDLQITKYYQTLLGHLTGQNKSYKNTMILDFGILRPIVRYTHISYPLLLWWTVKPRTGQYFSILGYKKTSRSVQGLCMSGPEPSI